MYTQMGYLYDKSFIIEHKLITVECDPWGDVLCTRTDSQTNWPFVTPNRQTFHTFNASFRKLNNETKDFNNKGQHLL